VKDSEHSGHIDYAADGFTLSWDDRELRIEVTDYHAGVLHLPWGTILDIAKRAGQRIVLRKG
jgi:hypothetical protein